MSRHQVAATRRHAVAASAAFALAGAGAPALAAPTELADIPMADSTTASVLPNLSFILDDSHSMNDAHMPPYVALAAPGAYCRGTSGGKPVLKACNASGTLGSNTFVNAEPPYYASAFNAIYYNPLVDYSPPPDCSAGRLDAAGNCGAMTSYRGDEADGVPNDGYDIQDGGKTRLVTEFPETVACSGTGYSPAGCKPLIDGSAGAPAYKYPDAAYSNLVRKNGAPFYYNVTVQWCSSKETTGDKLWGKSGTCQAKRDGSHPYVLYTDWQRVDIVPAVNSYPGPNGGTRTYAQELSNFANWYAWYHTRLQMAKTAIGLAFKDVRGTPNTADPADPQSFHARIGFTVINDPGVSGDKFLTIGNFDQSQKAAFYQKLYAVRTAGSTPLRAALSKAGRIYAHTYPGAADPVTNLCQRNFALMATDGGWNENAETGGYQPFRMDGNTTVGDCDGSGGCGVEKSAITRPEFDKLHAANTLADVAYYYYHTNLRPATCTPDNCPQPVPPSSPNPQSTLDDVAPWQHMTTFTVGLGVDGTLAYQDNYKTSTSGDFHDIVQGTKDWPDPTSTLSCTDDCPPEKIDDLWHAAVNGRGSYFSARDPGALRDGLVRALKVIKTTTGSGAAAATSDLQFTAGDNFIYLATYRTLYWDGELSAYGTNLETGALDATPSWQAGAALRARIAAAGDSDTRTIYTANGQSRILFSAGSGGLAPEQLALFDNAPLSQTASWDAGQKAAATAAQLVNYLRGQNRYEDVPRDAGYGSYQRLYRARESILGDIVHSQPVYVQEPTYQFADDGYAGFKTAQAGRAGTVYAAANDGMLHAFDAKTGAERWAYVPPIVLPQLWQLADAGFGASHRFMLDGPLTVSDARINGAWATVLIGALGKGGRGYYALDITDPANPKPLWNFSANDNANLGYSYGAAFITKLGGAWVAVLGSGYDNIPEGGKYGGASGKGCLFVLDLADGKLLKTISTGAGSTDNPSGLARLNLKAEDFTHDNSATVAYGGDLLGNLWSFDLAQGTARKVAALGAAKPITVAPELGEFNGKQLVFFGTGRYLGKSDLGNADIQSIFGLRDDGATTITGTGSLRQQTVSSQPATRRVTNEPVDWSSQSGWYLDLPESGERVTIDPQLHLGTLVVASTVPTASACEPGGHGWLYQLDYRTGGGGDDYAVARTSSPIAGVTVVQLAGGTVAVYPIPSNGQAPAPNFLKGVDNGGGELRRVLWREILD